MRLIREGDLVGAVHLIRQTLPFPGTIGRICTQPCEEACKRSEVDRPISVAALKRAAADWAGEIEEDLYIAEEKGGKVAVVGGGPAGLMAAYDLRKKGYRVTLFEALPLLGGMMAAGIPAFRLPRNVLNREAGIIERLGVEVRLNTRVGKEIAFTDLLNGYEAIFLATGANRSSKIRIPGTDLEGVFWGVDFLRAANLENRVKAPKKVVIVGGGNVAVDVAMTGTQAGCEKD